jgi:hypothetical protein
MISFPMQQQFASLRKIFCFQYIRICFDRVIFLCFDLVIFLCFDLKLYCGSSLFKAAKHCFYEIYILLPVKFKFATVY